MVHPRSGIDQTQKAKHHHHHHSAKKAHDYGLQSLYNATSDMTNYMNTNHISQKKAGQRSGPGGYGCNAPTTYAAGHGDPVWRRTTDVGREVPSSLAEMQKTYPLMTKEKYE